MLEFLPVKQDLEAITPPMNPRSTRLETSTPNHYTTDEPKIYQTRDKHANHYMLDFYSGSSLKQQSTGRHVAPLGHIILIPGYSGSSLKQQSAGRHVAPLGHIILIPSQRVFALSP